MFLGEQKGACVLLAPPSENPKLQMQTTKKRRQRGANSILRSHGAQAMYNGYLPVQVIHRTNVERIGDSGEVIIDDNQISFNSMHIPFAKRGASITVNGLTLTLKTPLTTTRDGLQVWVVN